MLKKIMKTGIKTTLEDFLLFYIGKNWEDEDDWNWRSTDTRYFIGEYLEIPENEVHEFLLNHKKDTVYIKNYGLSGGYADIHIAGFGDKIIKVDSIDAYSLDWRDKTK